ncbi:MAG: hypothetical protein KJ649_06365 [Proteobacteria bacterium]|nr:hypothetical protein [Pseudomonadota bacterium]MBU1744500.1 hypothetical protein [Pseudomonadota bacterium]
MTKPSTRKASHNSPPQKAVRLSLNERLALISLIDEGIRGGASDSAIITDLFTELGDLVNATVSGAKIDRLRSENANGFKTLEITADTGENMGRLNMLYLKKPISCYYLVYVEVASPFRNRGLGNRILSAFSDFLIKRSAVGILDNIIPKEDPTYDIYLKFEWQPGEAITGIPNSDDNSLYMVFIPPGLAGRDLKTPVRKLIHHIKRKRAAIDMRDNELMVQKTIEEFKDLYAALMTYFEKEIRSEEPSSVVRFMFTRFVTKLLGFRRRIGRLLGYTGGESLEQIILAPEVRAMPVQSYAPRELVDKTYLLSGDKELWLELPETLKQNPARMIESLPNYRRPSLVSWLESQGRSSSETLTIGDLMDLGFDPTRLKETSLGGQEFIFERLQARMIPQVERKKDLIEQVMPDLEGIRIKNARVQGNPPLLFIRDRGNAYVLRRKVDGIHWEEAVEQLQTAPELKGFNKRISADRIVLSTVRQVSQWLREKLGDQEDQMMDLFTFFAAWDLAANHPIFVVDFSGSYLETVWIA